jgi:hypothetical protein
MRRLLLLVIVVCVAFVYICRERLYLRDPLASVERAGTKVSETRVLINYPNDILLEDDSAGRHRIYLVQNWNLTPSAPAHLTCTANLACLADADHATATPIPGTKGVPAVMTNKRVEFVDEDGKKIVVTLR